jgi:2-polyprenyl-3-methyl-5-hydroxy-6-metoxy-1,4-benzoquinol methylase
LTASTARSFGIEKAVVEPSKIRRLGYRLFGEIHISGRIRLYHVFAAIARLNCLPTGIRMLDAGTGRGDISLHFARLNSDWHIDAIDIQQERVEHCREVVRALGIRNVHLERRDLLDLDSNAEYDLITNTDVLEHIPDDMRALSNMACALKPGGHLLLTFPADPSRRHLRLLRWIERRRGSARGVAGHVREGYSPDGIRRMLNQVGLKTESVKHTSYGPFGTLAHDLFFIIGDSEVNPLVFALALPFLLILTFVELHTLTRKGSALLVVARKPK